MKIGFAYKLIIWIWYDNYWFTTFNFHSIVEILKILSFFYVKEKTARVIKIKEQKD